MKDSDNNDTTHARLLHDKSLAVYGHLDLDDDEYIVIDVQRSRVGLFLIWFTVIVVSILFIAVAQLLDLILPEIADRFLVVVAGYLIVAIILIIGVVAVSIYRDNKLIISNKRIFSRIQNAPFAYRWQTIEIEHIEDVSYTQNGILQTILDYGTVRLSTVGDEHTYVFTFVADPGGQYKTINKVVQAVDEGEPTKFIQ